MKARGITHDRDIREFDITPKGAVAETQFTAAEQILQDGARRPIVQEAQAATEYDDAGERMK